MEFGKLPLDAAFSLVNTMALLSWIVLITMPRKRVFRRTIQGFILFVLCLLYCALIQVYFFGVTGGGFFSLGAVQKLFESREIALAGWIHYLAFDLFVGLWIAQRADIMLMSRWLQAPILVTTFMFGPIGLFMFSIVAFAATTENVERVTTLPENDKVSGSMQ